MTGERVTILIALFILVTVAGVAVAVYRFVESERLEDERYELGETELIVVNTTGSQVSLHRSSGNIAEVDLVPNFDGDRIWLPAGSYFLKLDREPAIGSGDEKGT